MEKTCAKVYKFGILLWSKYTLITAIAKTEEKRLAALSMLHKAKKAYYAFDVIRFLVPYAARNRLAARTGCAVHAPCLLAVRQLP